MENNPDLKLIVGSIGFEDLESGFWFLEDKANYKWRINDIPIDLKKNGINIAVIAKISQQEMSIFMTGKAIEIIDFEIL